VTLINIAPYSPDNATLSGQYSAYVKNVLVGQDSYMPFPSLEKISEVQPNKIYGAIAFTDLFGKVKFFIGTNKKLLILDGYGWKDVSAQGVEYNASKEAPWSFALFGKYIIAVNVNDNPQIFEVGHSNNFRDLGGKPPRAGKAVVWGDFLCLMGLPDAPNRVFWSGLNNIECWTPQKESCDYQDFPEGGTVQGSSQDSNPIIFLENAIYYGQFLPGSDIIFSFKKIYGGQGAKFSGSIVGRGQNIFYVDNKGFFQINGAGENIPIGYGYINRTIFEKMSGTSEAVIANIEAVIDPYANRVYWAIDYDGSGKFTEILVYDWQNAVWSRIEIGISWIVPMYSLGYTLESLDNISKDINNFPYSFDDLRWKGGYPLLAAFDKDGYLCSFTGKSMSAVIESQEFSTSDGTMQLLSRVRPIIDSDKFTVTIGKRQNFDKAIQWTKAYSASPHTGSVATYIRSRYLRFRLNINEGANWTHMRGFDAIFSSSGKK